MPLDPAFVEDCPYAPEGLLLEEILEVDEARSRIVARMNVHEDLPITRAQRAHPVRHPRHLSGGLMIHLTGMVGFAHAYYLLHLRHRDGWIGYGVKIQEGRFSALATPGTPLLLEGVATRVRPSKNQILARYHFTFRQDEKLVYEGDQTAMWMRVAEP